MSSVNNVHSTTTTTPKRVRTSEETRMQDVATWNEINFGDLLDASNEAVRMYVEETTAEVHANVRRKLNQDVKHSTAKVAKMFHQEWPDSRIAFSVFDWLTFPEEFTTDEIDIIAEKLDDEIAAPDTYYVDKVLIQRAANPEYVKVLFSVVFDG